MIRLYEAYEDACRRNGVVDFAELLLRSHELWKDVPGLVDHYRSRFGHVLVDEFQDTNTIQYSWMKTLVGSTSIPFVVGDDDQSIYRWRGAQGREPAAVPPRLPGRAALPPRAELPLDRHDPRGRERDHRHEQRPHRQEALDRGRQGRADPALSRLQRARRGGVRREPDPRLGRARRQPARHGHPLPLERAVARVRGIPARGAHPLPRLRRPAVLRAPGDQGRARVPAPDRQPRRRRVVRSRREPAHARHRCAHARGAARACEGARAFAVAFVDGVHRRARRQGHGEPAGLPRAHREARRGHAGPAAARAGGPRDPGERPRGSLPARQGGQGRGPPREPRGTRERGARLRAGGRRHAAAGLVPVARGARVRRRPGGGVGRLRADDDAALGQGPRVPGRVPVRPRGRPVPAPALDRRPAGPRGRAPPLLRRHHPRHAQALPDLRRAAPDARRGQLRRAVPVHRRDPRRAGGGGPAAGPGLASVLCAGPAVEPAPPGGALPVLRRRFAGQPAARPARTAPEVRRRRGAQRRGAGLERPRAGQFRAPGHQVADDGLRQPRKSSSATIPR